MSTFIDYYEYSKLANAAYVDLLDQHGQLMNGENIAAAVNGAERLPAALADQTFRPSVDNANNPWRVSTGGFHANDAEGFAATLFEKSGQKVLAIRGTAGQQGQRHLVF